jgi:hypothetical protein
MGASVVINPKRDDVRQRILEETGNNGAGHIVFITFYFHSDIFQSNFVMSYTFSY